MKYWIIIVIFLIVLCAAFILLSPGHKPASWNKINCKIKRYELYKFIGHPTDIDTDARLEFWSKKQYNGYWVLTIRFDSDNDEMANVSVGDYTFHNWFYDADWNPLPKPYSLANFTTRSIP